MTSTSPTSAAWIFRWSSGALSNLATQQPSNLYSATACKMLPPNVPPPVRPRSEEPHPLVSLADRRGDGRGGTGLHDRSGGCERPESVPVRVVDDHRVQAGIRADHRQHLRADGRVAAHRRPYRRGDLPAQGPRPAPVEA